MTDTGIECGHYITLAGQPLGWALRSGIVQTGITESVWIETVDNYDLVTEYVSLYTDEQDRVPRQTVVMLRETYEQVVGIQ